jgi:NTE family protein
MNAEKSRRKIGLALSGGAARGLAHIGVLDVFIQKGIPIDLIAGTSAGALIGAIYAASRDISRVKKDAVEANWRTWAPLIDPSLPIHSGLIKGEKITELLTRYIGRDTEFGDLKIPFACTATDIETGEVVIIDQGPVTEAVRASISIPTIFTAVKREGRYLVDGGLTTPVPINVVREMGADFVIAVNVTPDITAQRAKSKPVSEKAPSILHIILQALYITTGSLVKQSLADADIVIEPDLVHITSADFQKSAEVVARGEQAARRAIPEIKKALNLP